MNRMMRGYPIALAAVIFFTANGALADNHVMPDGRFGSRCPAGIGGGAELCDLSFYRLLANAEKYDARLVRVSGFLIRDMGLLVIYPQHLSYESGSTMEGVVVDGKLPSDLAKTVDKGIWPVRVVGRFNARCLGAMTTYSGCIENIVSIRKISTIRPVKPKN